jgi:hypothetical protein
MSCVNAVQNLQGAEKRQNEARKNQLKMKKEMESRMKMDDNRSKKSIERIRPEGRLRARESNECRVLPFEDSPPLVEERFYARQVVTDAATIILQRGVPPNSGLDHFTCQELEAKVWEVANNQYMMWLTVPFLEGLIRGSRAINQRVSQHGQSLPILHWLCQYKLLRQFGYWGGDGMVALALMAGANVKMKATNKKMPSSLL